MILMCWGLLRAMQLEMVKQRSTREARLLPAGLGGENWKARLQALVRHPTLAEVRAFIDSQVRPALEEVAQELRRQGLDARVDTGDDGRVWVEVGHGAEMDFFYSVRPQAYEPPSFILSDPRRQQRDTDDVDYRAEVHLREGGQGYDVMGWRREALIHDVLDQYQRHLHFLQLVR